MHKGQLIILESTTYPGYTREVLAEQLRGRLQARLGLDLFVAFSPERVDPGNKTYSTHNTPKVVGGVTQACGGLTKTFYGQFIERVHQVSTADTAELVKLHENTFRAVNIGLANELGILARKLDIDVHEVIAAAMTKPFGFMPFYPGPGIGGHCIPLDPMYLSWRMRAFGYAVRFIELADAINSTGPQRVVERTIEALNSQSLSVKESKILILGVAYKPDINDARETPAVNIIRLLEAMEPSRVDFYDPRVSKLQLSHDAVDEVSWVIEKAGLTEEPKSYADWDVVVIVTDHTSGVDYQRLLEQAHVVVDTRNAIGSRMPMVPGAAAPVWKL